MMELLQTLARGGPVMIPLALCSLASLTIIVDRAMAFRRARADTMTLLSALGTRIAHGDIAGALKRCLATRGPIAAVLAEGLRHAAQPERTEKAMEAQALAELPALQRGLVVLDTVVTAAPLLGLLGTVLGMIRSFRILAVSGASHPTGITAGLAEALVATATGLVIAIISLVGYNYFLDCVRRCTSEMEMAATQLAHWLGAREIRQQASVHAEEALYAPAAR